MIIKTDKSQIEDFLVDSANYIGQCDAVYFPESEEDVIKILQESNQNNQKVTVAGNGTGLTGARVPEGGIVISTSKLNKIIELNFDERYAIVQPGVILNDFQEQVRIKGLYYPPDPTEQDCFIGATVATNASGAKSFKYGPTRNFVESLRIILPNGDSLTIKRGSIFTKDKFITIQTDNEAIINIPLPDYNMPEIKNSAGYYYKNGMDVIDLFIGSEGTLGIISEIKLKLLNAPENLVSGVLFFNKENDALDFADAAREFSYKSRNNNLDDLNARGIEFFDNGSLEFIKEEYPQIPEVVDSAIWFEQEVNSKNEEFITEKWLKLAEKYNTDLELSWFASDLSEIKKFKVFRHAVSAKVTEFISSKGVKKIGTDTAVPSQNFRKYYELMKIKVKEQGLRYICYGHIGDSHLHLNMLPEDSAQLLKAKETYNQLCNLAVELGGTVSAEHGIGKMKREHLLKMYGEENISQMAKIKKALDPNLILGIGNIFDPKYLQNE